MMRSTIVHVGLAFHNSVRFVCLLSKQTSISEKNNLRVSYFPDGAEAVVIGKMRKHKIFWLSVLKYFLGNFLSKIIKIV